jgi:hypothetical protein
MAVGFGRFNSIKRRVRAGPGRMNENQAAADHISRSCSYRCVMNIRKTIAVVALACSLGACGAVDLISQGMTYSKAVAADLKQATGTKPQVGFNWHNGKLQSVTVMFPKVYVGKPLDKLAGTVREVVARDFKQAPDTIVLGVALNK